MALLGNLTGSSQYFNDYRVYNGIATQSLRFDDGSSAYLTRTPSSAGNRLKWTWSGWFKRTTHATGSIFMAGTNASNDGQIYFTTNTLRILNRVSSSVNTIKDNSALYRDSSAWYHVVVIWDTAQSNADDRVREYVNGQRITAFGSNTIPSQNTTSIINNNVAHRIGAVTNNSQYFDGYMAEINFLDGYTVGETNGYLDELGEVKNGVWVPKKYTGSYGTNGFRLQFNQTGVGTASSSTIGADTSGQNNHWTSSGIVASDCNMPDSPENNFCTINPISSGAGTFSEGNLKYVSTTDTGDGTLGISSGKFYAEVYVNSNSNSYIGVHDIRNLSPTRGGGWSSHGAIAYKQNGDQYSLPVGGSSATASYGASYTSGDIIGIAADIDSDTVTFYKNGSSQGNTTNGISHISSGGFYSVLVYGSNSTFTVNFGQDSSFAGTETAQGNTDGNGIGDFYYAPPSGFLALCTSNLPEPTISPNAATQADDYFNTVLYSGNGSTQSITDVGFQSDWVWIKNRNGTGIHGLFDSSRGATKYLSSNSLNDEATASGVTSFDSNGFSLGSAFNQSSLTFVAWNWKANGGTTSTNDDGSIQSTVQANTTAGFSIVQYVATGSNATVGHGLSVEPDTVWVKNRDTDNRHFMSYWKPLGNTDRMLFTTGATASTSASFNNTSPTSTVFSIGTSSHVNDASDNYIAYCFHSVEGYSKIGSYTGNGNANGPFVFLGLKPSFILIKRTDTAEDWWIYDNKRDTFNPNTQIIYANDDNAEITGTGDNISNDFVSNGIKLRTANVNWNASGGTYIYMAFAEAPFKYANAR